MEFGYDADMLCVSWSHEWKGETKPGSASHFKLICVKFDTIA